MEDAGVSSETLAEYLPRVNRYARRFNGVQGAEFDDLSQEGLLKVFLLLRDEKPVSNTAIKNAMRDWVRFCGRKGQSVTMDDSALDYYATAAPGKRRNSDGEWGRWADVL